MDDGSTDHTDDVVGEYVQKDSRFKYYHRTEEYSKGANSCRHIGFLKSKGDYINWFDSDDLMISTHIDKKVRKITEANYDFVSCEIVRFRYDKKNELIKIPYNYEDGDEIINQFIGELTLHTAGVFWKRDFLNNNQLYYKSDKLNQNDSCLNDWTFGLDALMMTKNFAFIKEALVLYRYHDNSIYTDRIQGNTKKLLDEFRIRKEYHEKVVRYIGHDIRIEKYYINRILKIIRTLIKKKISSYNLMCIVLKNNDVPIKSKIRLLFNYLLTITTGKGIHRLKLS